MLKATIDGDSIRQAIAMLKDLDQDVLKHLKGDLQSALSNVSSEIAADVPTDAPLSGMGVDRGRLRWGKVGVPKVSITGGKTRGIKRLVSITVGARPDAGLKMVELAGSKNVITQKRGEIMITRLNERYPWKGKAGRFAFKKFRELRPEVLEITKKILNDYLEQVNRRL
jgi:hypothetical protein